MRFSTTSGDFYLTIFLKSVIPKDYIFKVTGKLTLHFIYLGASSG